ncbi:MAG: hypothetical protein RRZ38_13860 [Hafnia sp.]|nr:hypothetical protein [Hafnia paralvei]
MFLLADREECRRQPGALAVMVPAIARMSVRVSTIMGGIAALVPVVMWWWGMMAAMIWNNASA